MTMRFWKPISEFLHNPEWMAALVLFIQAIILVMQTKILGRHAATMEKHTEIAGTQAKTMEKHTEIASSQAKTAESIGNAVAQQGKILAEQTKIMEEQFKFQRRLEERSERARIVEQLFELNIEVKTLNAILESTAEYTPDVQTRVRLREQNVTALAARCLRELRSAIHVSTEEKEYFLGFVHDANNIPDSSPTNFSEVIAQLKDLAGKYKDVTQKIFAAASTPL